MVEVYKSVDSVLLGLKDPTATSSLKKSSRREAKVGIMGKRVRAESPYNEVQKLFLEDGQLKSRPTLCLRCLQVRQWEWQHHQWLARSNELGL